MIIMDNKQFQELFLTVHGEDIWKLRKERIKKILRELLNGKFKDEIQERRFLVRIKKLECGCNAQVFRKADPVIIELNEEYWERHPELDDHNNTRLRKTLIHELTHVAIDKGDKDPLFELELKRRG